MNVELEYTDVELRRQIINNLKIMEINYAQYCAVRDMSYLQGYIGTLPTVDLPQAVGQHPNAEISFRREETMTLLDGLLALQNAAEVVVGETREEEDLQTIVGEILAQVCSRLLTYW